MKEIKIGELNVVNMLQQNHNIILHGAPGTGKTYLAREIAKAMCGVDDIKKLEESGQFKMVQFHPSYDYTDFVEGLRPTDKNEKGEVVKDIHFVRTDGIFKAFCKKAVETCGVYSIPPTYNEVFKILYDKVKDKKIDGIQDIREESDRHGMRIVFDVKRDFNTQVVLNTLFTKKKNPFDHNLT